MRYCSIAGCKNKVKSNVFYFCSKCWHEYAPDDVPAEWMKELVRMVRREERREKRINSHEIAFSRFLSDEIHRGDGTTASLENLDWVERVQFIEQFRKHRPIYLRDEEDQELE